jgi:formylglycine-generating enzyme required for sulfatase activity
MTTPLLTNLFYPLTAVWQNISETLLMPHELLAIVPADKTFIVATDQLAQLIENEELTATYQLLHNEIAIFNTLQNHVSVNLNKDPLSFKDTLPAYLITIQQNFQGQEHLLNKNLRDRLAILIEDFRQNQGRLNYQDLSKLQVLRADLQKYCLQKQRELQLELKYVEAQQAEKIAIYHRQTVINTIQEEKRQANSPILIVAEDIIKQADFSQVPQPLRVFFAPPILSHERQQNSSDFPIAEETLENYLRAFWQKYTDSGRIIDFFGGAWKSNLLRGETAANNLFIKLQSLPTLILDAIAPEHNFQLRYSFWPGHSLSFRYQSPINYLPWQELLYNFAKQRSINWQVNIEQRQAEGEKETDIKSEYSLTTLNNYQHNLQMLAREKKYLGRGKTDLTRMDDRFYHLHNKDYEDLGKIIGLCQNIIGGLIADEYFLVHVPVHARKMPLLPYLLPELLKNIEPAEQLPLIEMIVSFYNNLYNVFLQPTESAWIPDLRLQLAEHLLVLPDKQWGISQIFASIDSWLNLRGIATNIEPISQLRTSHLSHILANHLTIADQDYINKVNQCFVQAGEKQEFNILSSCWQRGIEYLKRGEYACAIDDLTQVLQLDTDHIANYHRGIAHSCVHQYEEAIADFDRVLKLNTDDAQVYYERGSVYYQLGEYQKSLDDYHQAWLLDPHIPNLAYRRDVTKGILKQIEIDQLKQVEQRKGEKLSLEIISVNTWGEEINRKTSTVYQKQENLGEGINLAMIYIPAGTFFMGANSGEIGASEDEYPQHQVNISQPFYMSKYPITQAQYKVIMNGENPSDAEGDQRPVERITWNMAINYCQRLSAKTGKTYRLPSEAEWEYAARAGTQTPFHFGETLTDKLANYRANYTYGNGPRGAELGETIDVGNYPPNAFGLSDIHGNVWEWCQDDWHKNYYNAPNDGNAWLNTDSNIKILRGGSWCDGPNYCRVATRYYIHRSFIDNLFGFRVCTQYM